MMGPDPCTETAIPPPTAPCGVLSSRSRCSTDSLGGARHRQLSCTSFGAGAVANFTAAIVPQGASGIAYRSAAEYVACDGADASIFAVILVPRVAGTPRATAA